MRIKKYGHPVFVLLTAMMFFASCSDDWENHYNTETVGKSDLSLYDYIKTQDDLSIFAGMLQQTGYDSILSQSQTYTVWAPTNLALQDVDLSDADLVMNLVTNHIARFSCPTLEAKEKTIYMLNNKRLIFGSTGDKFTFDNKVILRSDISVFNGVLHVIDGYAPYRLNHWEYLMNTSGIDSLKTFLNALTYKQLDLEKSYKDEVFVDSFFIISNMAKNILGDFDKEDSIYTIIVPDNKAWIESYEKIWPFYNTLKSDGGAIAQNWNTKWALIRDLMFRGRKTLPLTDETLISTYGNKLTNPNTLFEGSQRFDLSNGYVYKTSSLKHNPVESWYKEIRIEAEDQQDGKRIATNYAVSTVSGLGTGFDVSENFYVAAVPKTSSAISKLSLVFPIPNTLSAKYNIYAVFVPTYAIDKSDKRPYKLNFYLSYIDKTGSQLTNSRLIVEKNITDTTSMTKLLLTKDFEFKYCNITDQLGMVTGNNTTVQLKIENAAGTTASETAKYNRTIRVDCIILEPVQ